MADKQGPRRALIVAGEASGDHLAAGVVRAARAVDPGLSFFGVGGEELAAAGCEIIIPSSELAVMGLFEVVRHYPRIRRVFGRLSAILGGPAPPDLLLTVDYQDFNLRLAARAKAAGVPALHYVSPTVWAWRPGRVKTVARSVDHLAVLFPFEPACYEGTGLAVTFVGNPLVDDLAAVSPSAATRAAHGLPVDRPVVGLFPGSRLSEVRHAFSAILGAAGVVLAARPDARFLLPLAPTLPGEAVEGPLRESGLPVTVVRGGFADAAAACDAAIVFSGTATLQTALAGTPMAIVYRTSAASFALARLLVRTPHIGLANIVAGEAVVSEFIQQDASPDRIGGEILRILDDPAYREGMKRKLAGVRERLGPPGASERVARIASQMSRREIAT
jgi:lipid-A-disaccharide synthase